MSEDKHAYIVEAKTCVAFLKEESAYLVYQNITLADGRESGFEWGIFKDKESFKNFSDDVLSLEWKKDGVSSKIIKETTNQTCE